MKVPLFVLIALYFLILSGARGQFVQQGSKLVGNGAVGISNQGYSVSLSTGGNTAIVGGPEDNTWMGAAWVYTNSGGVWTQQGNKLVGSGAVWLPYQGTSVSLSADGNTAMVGGPGDDFSRGAVWVFTRSDSVWTQQGEKLVGTDIEGFDGLFQGTSVALSADGNTAIFGGIEFSSSNNDATWEAWVYTRGGSVWTQQGNRLIGTDASGIPSQGASVSLSADGNTAIMGGSNDNNNTGAAWIYTRSGGVWSQQGSKLVGTGAAGLSFQGSSVFLSADGNTAIVGGPGDNDSIGAVWLYTRSGDVWSQQGSKLVGAGAAGISFQGSAVSLSTDGNTAIVGGPFDNNDTGASWMFTRSNSVWTQQGNKLVGSGAVNTFKTTVYQGCSVSISGDSTTAFVGGYADSGGAGAVWVFTYSNVQGVHDLTNAPFSYHLSENYPNPFNPTTQISYTLAKASNVTLNVYNVLGLQIATLVNGKNEPGEHSVRWNAANIPSGVYFFRIVAGEFVQTKKMVLMK